MANAMPQLQSRSLGSQVPSVSGVKVWLDAGITIERLAPLPAGARLELQGGVASLQVKGKGAA